MKPPNIKDAYINALLADATYALTDNSSTALTGAPLALLLEDRMTATLAKYIGESFTVITHIESGDSFGEGAGSGFDAAVWRKTDSGQIYVSMQGTTGLQDFISDIDLTIGNGAPARQIVDMVNWWLRITTPSGQLTKQIGLIDFSIPFVPIVGGLIPDFFMRLSLR